MLSPETLDSARRRICSANSPTFLISGNSGSHWLALLSRGSRSTRPADSMLLTLDKTSKHPCVRQRPASLRTTFHVCLHCFPSDLRAQLQAISAFPARFLSTRSSFIGDLVSSLSRKEPGVIVSFEVPDLHPAPTNFNGVLGRPLFSVHQALLLAFRLVNLSSPHMCRQTVFFTSVDPMKKEHKYPNNMDLEAPRLAWYKQKKWKIDQDTVYWVDIQLVLKKGLKFYQTRSNAIILYDTLPAYCIPKAIMMETGEIIYEKVYASLRPPPKISLDERIGFRSCWI